MRDTFGGMKLPTALFLPTQAQMLAASLPVSVISHQPHHLRQQGLGEWRWATKQLFLKPKPRRALVSESARPYLRVIGLQVLQR